mgnify:CR=1 FL=1
MADVLSTENMSKMLQELESMLQKVGDGQLGVADINIADVAARYGLELCYICLKPAEDSMVCNKCKEKTGE